MSEEELAEIQAKLEDHAQAYENDWPMPDAPHDYVSHVPELLLEIERLRAQNAALREIVDALANEGRYQSETREGSMAYLARLVPKARALLGEKDVS